MNLPVNIADLAIAERVHRRVNANFFAIQLKALQDVAAASDYCFVQCPAEEEIGNLPANLERAMEEAVMRVRFNFLYPEETAEKKAYWFQESLEDGFANTLTWELLHALDDLGLRLQRRPQMYLPADKLNFAPSVFDDENEAKPDTEVTIETPVTRHRWWWPFPASAKA